MELPANCKMIGCLKRGTPIMIGGKYFIVGSDENDNPDSPSRIVMFADKDVRGETIVSANLIVTVLAEVQ